MSWFEFVSVRPLCSMWLHGESLLAIAHHRATENTEVTQRKLELDTTARQVLMHFQRGIVKRDAF